MPSKGHLYCVVRLRGTSGLSPDLERTLELLRVRRKFTASIYHSSLPGIREMLVKASDWAAWGELDKGALVELLRRRGRIRGNRRLTDEWARENLGLKGLEEMAEKLLAGELHYHRLEDKGVKPFFRLHPPKGGFKGTIKKHYRAGGELGYRGRAINELIMRMV